MKKVTNKKQFVVKASFIHNNIFDYSEFEYFNSRTKGTIICKLCYDKFSQTPNRHLSGQGCANCAGVKKITLETFIEKSKKIHGDKFDYSKFIYIDAYTEGILICKKCNREFVQKPCNNLNYRGCPKCAGRNKTTEEFIMQAKLIHGNKYDYSKFIYAGAKIKGLIHCINCNYEFYQLPNNHINGSGCLKCGIQNRTKALTKNMDFFIKKAIEIHGNKFDYSKFVYIKSKIKGIIICKKCETEFLQAPNRHLIGHGCPYCLYKNEQLVSDILTELSIKHIRQYKIPAKDKKILKRGIIYCDFYIPSLNLIIEYNGRQHYEECIFVTNRKLDTKEQSKKNFIKQKKIDEMRRAYCKKNNIELLEIDGRIYYGSRLKSYIKMYFSNGIK